jgi:hypothetical protein
MQQLANGQISWKEFDFKHLRFEAGMDGYNAVANFARQPTVEISDHGRAYLDDLIAADSRWGIDLAIDSPEERRNAIHFRNGETPPADLVDHVINDNYYARECTDEESRCALVSIVLRRNGETDWLFMFDGEHSRDWQLYKRANDKWQRAGRISPWGKRNNNAFDNVFNGDYLTPEPEWLDLDAGGGPMSIND